MRIRTRIAIIMLSQGLSQATTIILGIILVRIISQETLGTYRQVFLVHALLVGILSFQLEVSLYYFLPKLGPERHRTLVVQTGATTLVMSAVVAAIMFLAAEPIARSMNSAELAALLRVFCLYPFFERLIALVPAFMISLDRATWAAAYSLVFSVGRVGVTALVFALGGSLATVMWASVVLTAAVALVGCAAMLRLSAGKVRLDFDLILQQLHYAWPILATSLVATINAQYDKLLISAFFDPAVYAVYSCGAFELPFISIINTSIARATMPNLVTLADAGKKANALHLWQEGARKCSLVAFPCFAFFLVIGPDLMVLMYGADYSMAAWPFAVYLLALPIHITVYGSIFRALGRTKPIAVSAIVALVTNVVLSTSLMWAGGGTLLAFVGPSAGAVGASLAMAGYLLWRLKGVIGVPLSDVMRWKELGKLLLLCVICALPVLALRLPPLPLIARLAVQAAAFVAIIVAALIWTGMLKADEKDILRLPLRIIQRSRSGAG
jgi:O-antigen/teichoic acid export membrane protein